VTARFTDLRERSPTVVRVNESFGRRTVKPIRATLILGGLATVLAAGAVAATPPSKATTPPIAGAAGGAPAVVLYPALVDVRMVRVRSLLAIASESEDMGDPTKAIAALTAVRSNLAKAWAAAKFVVDTAPPPAAPAALHVASIHKPARKSGAPVGGSPYADQYATAQAVLNLQHTVASTAIGMMDIATAPLLAALNTTMFAALNARDTAVAYLHSIEPPAAPAGVRVPASKAGAPIVAGWATTMQAILFDVDDELNQVDGMRALVNLSPSRKHLLDLAELQDSKTSRNINKFWPPAPAAG
jgi:hypothetical protein